MPMSRQQREIGLMLADSSGDGDRDGEVWSKRPRHCSCLVTVHVEHSLKKALGVRGDHRCNGCLAFSV